MKLVLSCIYRSNSFDSLLFLCFSLHICLQLGQEICGSSTTSTSLTKAAKISFSCKIHVLTRGWYFCEKTESTDQSWKNQSWPHKTLKHFIFHFKVCFFFVPKAQFGKGSSWTKKWNRSNRLDFCSSCHLNGTAIEPNKTSDPSVSLHEWEGNKSRF